MDGILNPVYYRITIVKRLNPSRFYGPIRTRLDLAHVAESGFAEVPRLMNEQTAGTVHAVEGGRTRGNSKVNVDMRNRVRWGYLLPTAEQLLRGFPFKRGDLDHDMETFAETLLREMDERHQSGEYAELRSSCREMLASRSLQAVRATADALRRVDLSTLSPDARDGKLRCWIYAVHLGDMDCVIPVAIAAVTTAYRQDWSSGDDPGDIIWHALGFLTLYASDIPELFPEPPHFATLERVEDQISFIAGEFRARMAACMRYPGAGHP